MPDLTNHEGRSVDLKTLGETEAAASTRAIRPILSGHPAQGLTPARLADLLREAENGDATPYLELAEEMEEKDLHYLSVLSTRKRAVAQLEIGIEDAGETPQDLANLELAKSLLRDGLLDDAVIDILDAIGKGYSVTEIIWESSEKQWRPKRLAWRQPQWFRFSRENGQDLMLQTAKGLEPLAPFKYIFHCAKVKSGLPIRGGLARAAAWAYLFKNYGLKDWLAFAEVYGQPLRLGRYHSGASEEEKDTLLRAVANLGSDAAAIVPQSMMIEFIEGKSGGGADIYRDLAEYLDAQISKAVLGQNLTTEVRSGSLAAAKVHDGVRGDIERADARQLAATLNRDLLRPLIELNHGPQARYPKLVIRPLQEENLSDLVEAVAKLAPLGLEVSQTDLRARLGLLPAEGETDRLKPSQGGA